MSKTKQLYACFVDFRKTYDSVEGLLFKALKVNIRGKVFNIIEDMLCYVLSYIEIQNNMFWSHSKELLVSNKEI